MKYSAGTSQQILRHMQQYHSEDLHSSTKKRSFEQQTFHEVMKKLKPVSESTSQEGYSLLLKWITQSYRPMSIVEDPGLAEYSAFLNGLEQKFTLPSRHTMTRLLRTAFTDTQFAIKRMIQKECDYYSLTSDIWTSRTSEAYISLMVHFITEDFDMRVVTLRCAPFSDVRHTGLAIANIVKQSLEDANMSLEKTVVYVTDNAGNAKKSATTLGVNHQGCVAHSLNLIVQKFIRGKGEDSTQTAIDDVPDRLKEVLHAIQLLREYAKYFGNSTIGSQWLKQSMERCNEGNKKIPLDVVTRWSSTARMLKAGLDVRLHLDAFCSYIHTEEGRAAFSNCSNIEQITHKQWFLLENVRSILDRFVEA